MYQITNRATGQSHEVEAPYAQEACERLGWRVGECHVQVLHEGPYTRAEAPLPATRSRVVEPAERPPDERARDMLDLFDRLRQSDRVRVLAIMRALEGLAEHEMGER